MGQDASALQAMSLAIAGWADRYTARFDQELTNAWPDLAERLRGTIVSLSWADLMFGPGKDFQHQRMEPAVRGWVERHVQPIIEDAADELRDLQQACPNVLEATPQAQCPGEGALHVLDVVKGLTLPAGLLVGGGAVATAITTITTWFIFTTVVVNWPLLIAGLVIGVTLSWFGVVTLAGLHRDLQERFRNNLLPKIREALVGDDAPKGGKSIPSLKVQLQSQVRERAEQLRKQLEK